MNGHHVAAPGWDDEGPASGEITRVRRGAPLLAGDAVRIEVDLDAVVSNARAVQQQVGFDVEVLAILKADAYGHGLAPVAAALHSSGAVAGFVVTSVLDAVVLDALRIDRPILCLPPTWDGRHHEIVRCGVVPLISATEDWLAFARVARRNDLTARVQVKIDTGMARLGIREDGVDELLAIAARTPELEISGMSTHLSSADEEDGAVTTRQLDTFDRIVARFHAAGHRPTMLHASNTAATWRQPRARFRHVRTGIALFGGDTPSGALLTPALRLVARIAQMRTVKVGEPVSYGERWHAARPTVVATLPLGYAHGYPRRLAGRAEALVHGRRCPVIGTICMEMMLVDVTDIERPKVGDEVVLFGAQEGEMIRPTDVADGMDGIVEEIFCGLSKAVPRDYVRLGQRTLASVPAVEERLNPEYA